MSRFFFDTEFIEYPPTHKYRKGTIDLISIGIVDDLGREFYAISNEFDESMASDWVRENVIAKLEDPTTHPRMSLYEIKNNLLNWYFKDVKDPEFYAYFCSYDWVVFCWIFGTMMELPKGFPMYCRDIKDRMKTFGVHKVDLPEQDEDTHHNALADAKWNKAAYAVIQKRVDKFNEAAGLGSLGRWA